MYNTQLISNGDVIRDMKTIYPLEKGAEILLLEEKYVVKSVDYEGQMVKFETLIRVKRGILKPFISIRPEFEGKANIERID